MFAVLARLWQRKPEQTLTAASFALAIAMSAALPSMPLYTSVRQELNPTTHVMKTVKTHKTLSEVNGARTLIFPLMLPPIVAFVPLLLRYRPVRIASAVVLVAFVLVGGFSVGMFYLPSAVMMVMASQKRIQT